MEDSQVSLVDLDGDGVTDAVRSGSQFECFFNDPQEGWTKTKPVSRKALEEFPNVNFADPRVKWADCSGDGLQDIVLVHDGNIEYWPNLGHGDWGPRIHMRNSPRFPYGYRPERILLGDVDGDGLADLVYVGAEEVTLWINKSGNEWSDPIEFDGTPPVTDMDAVRLVDLLGTGVAGLLWSSDAQSGRDNMFFLDFTGGTKPYLLDEMDNHMGALTRVAYAPSTEFYLEDEATPETRWQTPLPSPVQVVDRVESIDLISGGKLTTEYRYHYGYWDGAEKEFRGFGLVEQRDTETFETYNEPGLHGDEVEFVSVGSDDRDQFSEPTLTKTWFYQGPIGPEFGEWYEVDYGNEYWPGDVPMLTRADSDSPVELLDSPDLTRRDKRDALRALRGRILRTELYALDGSALADRPYTVTEQQHSVREVIDPEDSDGDPIEAERRVFFPHSTATRTTQWERGDDPMTQYSFTGGYDEYGQPRFSIEIAEPRLSEHQRLDGPDPYLGTFTVTNFAEVNDDNQYMVDRVIRSTSYKIEETDEISKWKDELRPDIEQVFNGESLPDREIAGQTITFYDGDNGDEFTGLPFGELDDYGAVTRTETLVLTEEILEAVYPDGDGVFNGNELPYFATDGNPEWPDDVPYPEAFKERYKSVSDETRTAYDGEELVPSPLGYGFSDGSGPFERGYYVATERRQYDFQSGDGERGLVTATMGPLGRKVGTKFEQRTDIEHDAEFALLPIMVTDPVGLTTEVTEYDYRLFQPLEVVDPNGNRTRNAYSPLGLLDRTAVMGKEGEEVGDTLEQPGMQFEYDLLAFEHEGLPASVRSIARIDHRWDIIKEENEERLANGELELTTDEIANLFPETEMEKFPERFIQTVEYSDGFGRIVQTRTQAEDVVFGNSVFGGFEESELEDNEIVGRELAPGEGPRVVVSGWQTYDNKGNVVEQYEPFYATGWDYLSRAEAEDAKTELGADEPSVFGSAVRMYYDPRGQVVKTVNPDESEQTVFYGRIEKDELETPETFSPSPWEAYTYDANDNAERTHDNDDGDASGDHVALPSEYEHHWNTPSSILIDALGRTIETNARNRTEDGGEILRHRTFSTYDIRGNVLSVIDALGREAFRYTYDLADTPLRTESIDAGVSVVVVDAAGSETERRDSKGAMVLGAFDELNRPTHLWARDREPEEDESAEQMTLRQRVVYGDASDEETEREARKESNQLGVPYKHYDEAGVMTVDKYDFKGNMLEKERRVLSDKAVLTMQPVDWEPESGSTFAERAEELLEENGYETSARYDGLNRVTSMRYPEDVEGDRKELRSEFNRAGALKRVELVHNLDGDETVETFVERIAYDAKGQRSLIAYGNGVLTRHVYDPETFQLVRMKTQYYDVEEATDPPTYELLDTVSKRRLQDLSYTYDLVGNIRRIVNTTRNSGVSATPDELTREFKYDALYQLTFASGRECAELGGGRPFTGVQPCGFGANHLTPTLENGPNLTLPYWERYDYDPAGNLLSMRHADHGNRNGEVRWTRHYGVEGSASNWNVEWPARLGAWTAIDVVSRESTWQEAYGNRMTHVGTDDAGAGQTHFYDANGNIRREKENGNRLYVWDYADRLCSFSEGTLEAKYCYDASGQRAKKVVRKGGNRTEVTVYVDGVFEGDRITSSEHVKENVHLHVIDDRHRIARVRLGGTIDGNDQTPAVQYTLSDHLQNSSIVVDKFGDWVNIEEYSPYGESVFGGFKRKRYRFSGKECDTESGLYYAQSRYYIPYLGKWSSPDPIGPIIDINLYIFNYNNPIRFIDPTGLNPKDESDKSIQYNFTVIESVSPEVNDEWSNVTLYWGSPTDPRSLQNNIDQIPGDTAPPLEVPSEIVTSDDPKKSAMRAREWYLQSLENESQLQRKKADIETTGKFGTAEQKYQESAKKNHQKKTRLAEAKRQREERFRRASERAEQAEREAAIWKTISDWSFRGMATGEAILVGLLALETGGTTLFYTYAGGAAFSAWKDPPTEPDISSEISATRAAYVQGLLDAAMTISPLKITAIKIATEGSEGAMTSTNDLVWDQVARTVPGGELIVDIFNKWFEYEISQYYKDKK
ncbi:toxin TcdB middle/N-terminal domain-containing protein [Haladaptatus sp. NG-WS-4]